MTQVWLSPASAAPDALAQGKPLFDRLCGSCHQIGLGAANGVGPALNGLAGRPAGLSRGYEYSTAMLRSAVIWTAKSFDAYVTDPEADMPGTHMGGPNVARADERAALFAYVSRFDSHGALKP